MFLQQCLFLSRLGCSEVNSLVWCFIRINLYRMFDQPFYSFFFFFFPCGLTALSHLKYLYSGFKSYHLHSPKLFKSWLLRFSALILLFYSLYYQYYYSLFYSNKTSHLSICKYSNWIRGWSEGPGWGQHRWQRASPTATGRLEENN